MDSKIIKGLADFVSHCPDIGESGGAALGTRKWPSRHKWQPILYVLASYKELTYMALRSPDQEWKKGSAELLVLSLLEDQPRHGYDLSKLIQIRSGGALRFHVTSLYPLLYRLEKRGLIDAHWVEKAEQRRRRYYKLTPLGLNVLGSQRKSWQEFIAAVGRVMGGEHA
jgi:PadR family transcriptional regulator, regulatory protein PadR